MRIYICRLTKKLKNRFGNYHFGSIIITRNEELMTRLLTSGYCRDAQSVDYEDFLNYDVPMQYDGESSLCDFL